MKIKGITVGCEEMRDEETAFRRLLGPVRKLPEPFVPSLLSSERLNHFYICGREREVEAPFPPRGSLLYTSKATSWETPQACLFLEML